ncbi:MAG: hypothetical protein ACRDGQ_00010 [Candidatus Limnocylindrales bacterium]
MTTRPSLLTLFPGLAALMGLAAPLIAGGGAGWPYVVGWLVVLALIGIVRPLRLTNRPGRIKWAAIATCLLVVPGLIVGGIYLVPAALVWLGIELRTQPSSVAT